jgi:dihydrofolate synthase/folylpolyglutamate synthase
MAELLGFCDSAIRKGVAEVIWPARLQWVDGDPPILIDGAHNPAAMKSLAASIPELAEERRVEVLFGAMQDKEVADMLPILGTLTRDPVFTAIPDERAAPPESLASMFGGGEVVNGVDAAIELARERARGDGLVLVCGSLALAGAVIEFIDQ